MVFSSVAPAGLRCPEQVALCHRTVDFGVVAELPSAAAVVAILSGNVVQGCPPIFVLHLRTLVALQRESSVASTSALMSEIALTVADIDMAVVRLAAVQLATPDRARRVALHPDSPGIHMNLLVTAWLAITDRDDPAGPSLLHDRCAVYDRLCADVTAGTRRWPALSRTTHITMLRPPATAITPFGGTG
ncbi:hypothetical protein [Nocardia sp. alder85J]|uniref:hypothetical protein n=1 Tax=Nocardia sp. alder85J TaxID=2862949 RepID=UPI001CD602D7|nr:hypothetical protein [Nocardia sp. alder85J]MCX4097751.1 hypothetical protein [Nocardia sp. alder85J]